MAAIGALQLVGDNRGVWVKMPQTGPLSAPDEEIECLVERSALSSSNKRTQAPMEPIDDGAMSPVSISVRKPLRNVRSTEDRATVPDR
jgi:hypothetical protein